MPELPEVETIVRSLRPILVGRTIVKAQVHWKRSVSPSRFSSRIANQIIARLGRRGKWIVIELQGPDTLLVHLRMTGRLALVTPGAPEVRYLRVAFSLDDGQRLGFLDQRKFGRLHLTRSPEDILGKLGPEPLGERFTVERLTAMLASRRRRIKPLLLDQTFLAGMGNIYVDEALWRAGIHPLRPANSITPSEAAQLHQGIRSVLTTAIASGGTTLGDGTFRQPDGQTGKFARQLAVYGRAGQPCLTCGTPVERTRVGQRGTHYCPRCQPAP